MNDYVAKEEINRPLFASVSVEVVNMGDLGS